MGNCLVTKLKSSVNNDNLEVFDELVINVSSIDNANADSQKLQMFPAASGYGDETFAAEIVGDGYFSTTYEGTSIGKTATLSKDRILVYCSNGDYKIKIKNKSNIGWVIGVMRMVPQNDLQYSNIVGIEYVRAASASFTGIKDWANLYYIQLSFATAFALNLTEIADKTLFDRLSVRACSIQGNISSLSNLTKLTRIELSDSALGNSAIYGDIVSMAALTKLTYCDLSNSGVSGNLEDLIDEWRNTKATGSLTFMLTGTSVKIYGNSISTGTSVSWTATTITCNGHTYDNNGQIVS